jgi:hypothetical protein
MDDIDEIRRANPQAMADLNSIKGAMKAIAKLRAAGVATGPAPLVAPHAGRYGQVPKVRRHSAAAFLKMPKSA